MPELFDPFYLLHDHVAWVVSAQTSVATGHEVSQWLQYGD